MKRFRDNILEKYTPIVLTLDNHGSRNGTDWLNYEVNATIEVVVGPANTTAMLQAIDQETNHEFQPSVR